MSQGTKKVKKKRKIERIQKKLTHSKRNSRGKKTLEKSPIPYQKTLSTHALYTSHEF